MKIKITEFGKRHFNKDFRETKILNSTPEEIENVLNCIEVEESFKTEKKSKKFSVNLYDDTFILRKGYAPFCKLLSIKNFTDAKVGSLPITLENYQYLRSGYSARNKNELPVFSRWLELPIDKPKAKYLVFVLYSKEQIDKEGRIVEDDYKPFDGDWGVVAILGQSHSKEEPMKPETMIRNALGESEGGSGVPLDKGKYLESVEFWNKNATVK